jgi:hypothetical protein
MGGRWSQDAVGKILRFAPFEAQSERDDRERQSPTQDAGLKVRRYKSKRTQDGCVKPALQVGLGWVD